MSETNMSPYIQGFNAGVDCVLTEIERLEKMVKKKSINKSAFIDRLINEEIDREDSKK